MTDSSACKKWNRFVSKYFGITWPGFIKTTLWIITAAILIYYTIRDINNLQDDYYNNNIATQTEVIQNVIVPKPPMMICLPYYSNALGNLTSYLILESKNSTDASNYTSPFYQWMIDHSWDVWKNDSGLVNDNNGNPYENKHVEEHLCAAVRIKLLDPQTGNINFSVLIQDANLDDEKKWNQPIIDCMFRLFAEISSTDFNAMGLGFVSRDDDQELNAPAYGGLGGWATDEQMDKLFELLLDIIQTVLSRGSTFEVGSEEFMNPPKIQDLKDSNIVILQDKICFSLLPHSFSEMFTMEDRSDVKPWYGLEGSYSIFSEIPTVSSLLSKSQAIYTGIARSSSFTSLQFILSPQTMIVESRTSRQDECSRERDQARCVATRQYQDILENFWCVPFSLKYYLQINDSSQLPYCNYSIYIENSRTDALHKELAAHQEKCSYMCEKTFYQWKPFESNRHIDGDESIFMHLYITFDRLKLPFLRFNLTDKTTREQYASSLGGIVGLYLGFSGFTACAMAILIYDILKRWVLIGRKAVIKPKNNAISRLQLYWMTGALMLSGQNDNATENQNIKVTVEKQQNEIDQLKQELAQIKMALNLTQASNSSQSHAEEHSTPL